MNTTRLMKSTIVLNVPGSGPQGLLMVSHPEGEDPVACLSRALGGSSEPGRETVQSEGGKLTWSGLMSLIESTDWSAHQLYVTGVESWGVLPMAAIEGES